MRVGRYELVDKLAEGGVAELFRARDGNGQVVVVKRLREEATGDADFVERFLGEIDLCRRFFHPNLVRAIDFGNDKGREFAVFEYVSGCNLEQLLTPARTQGVPVPIGVASFLIDQLLLGLSYAHDARSATGEPLGIVHRDVTPANVFLGVNGVVKLGDFGAALIPGLDDRMPNPLTMGKLGYLSPEQCMGEPVDQRSDLFSVGVIAAEIFGNMRLFSARPGEQTESVMYRIVEGRRPDLHALREEVPEGLSALVEKALARKPKDRFQTADAMRSSLSLFSDTTQTPLAFAAFLTGQLVRE